MSMQELIEKTVSDETLLNWAKNYESFHLNRIEWDVNYVGNIKNCDRILNIGGAPYIFEFKIRHDENSTVITLDLDPDRFSVLIDSLNIDVRKFNIETDDFIQLQEEIGNFDIVILCEIFEHLRIDIISTLKGIHSIMKNDGVLYLTTPNGLSLLALLRIFLSRRTGPSLVTEWRKLIDLGHMGHVREYSIKEVCEILTYCGFSIEKKIYRNVRFGNSLKGKIYYYFCKVIPFLSAPLMRQDRAEDRH